MHSFKYSVFLKAGAVPVQNVQIRFGKKLSLFNYSLK